MRFLVVAVFSIMLAMPMKAQDTTMTSRELQMYKDPATATIFSLIVTGGGHFYSGESGTGALLLGTAIGAPALGYVFSQQSMECGATTCQQATNATPLWIGLGVAALTQVYSIIDAGNAAQRANRRNGITLAPADEGMGLAMKVDL